MPDAIKLVGVTKTFGKIIANNNINMTVRQGEILSLLGENGSGKTTLMNILSGIYYPDEGQIFVGGNEVTISSPKDSFDLGIGMIHQHFKLVDVFTAAENIILGLPGKQKLDMKSVEKKITEICSRYGFDIDPKMKVYEMTVSQKQTVEIVKMLYRGANVLILDEPTAVLTPQETEKLFNVMREMKRDGKTVIIITHKLHEVLAVSDRVAILRKGEYIGTVETKDATELSLTEMMVGKKVSLDIERPVVSEKHKRISVENLTVIGPEDVPVLKNVSFDAYSGEILGIAGISGCGQKELLEAIAGLQHPVEGSRIDYIEPRTDTPESLIGKTPREIKELGITLSFVPEDRLGMGLVAGMSVMNNVILKSYNRNPGPFLDRKFARTLAEQIVHDFDISTPSVTHEVKKLSGGNIQKVLLGREIWLAPKVLITAYPVRGLDIGASYNIYRVLNEQKKKGVAVLFIGEDLDVLKSISDRLMVIHGGEVVDIVDPEKVTKEDIGMMMLGHKPGAEGGEAV